MGSFPETYNDPKLLRDSWASDYVRNVVEFRLRLEPGIH